MRIIFFSIIIIYLILETGCKAPIQLSRITFTEHFKQNFDFSRVDPAERVKFVGKMLSTKGVVNKFQKYISSSEGRKTNTALFKNMEVGTEGIITFTVSLLPYKKNPKRFEINGVGNYDIINSRNNQIYFTSTFHLTRCENCDDINRLIENDSFSLILKFTQVAINEFYYEEEEEEEEEEKEGEGKKYRHVPENEIEIRINLIKQKKYGEKCVSINYGTMNNPFKHSLYFAGMPIGSLVFTHPEDVGSKIIDLKNFNMLIRKYKNITP